MQICLTEGNSFYNAPFVATSKDPTAALHVLIEGRSALTNQIQLLKCMMMFAWINIMAQILVYSKYTNITDGQWMWNDLFVILPLTAQASSRTLLFS